LTVIARQTLEQNGSLDPQLAELDTLIRARDQAVRQAAGTACTTVLEHENRQYSTLLADNWLRVSRARTRSPEIASFLEQYWWRVMIAAAADGGIQGERWQQDSNTADELIWSVLPKHTADERKRLAGLASSLLGRIGAGLDSQSVSRLREKTLSQHPVRPADQRLAPPGTGSSARGRAPGTGQQPDRRNRLSRAQRATAPFSASAGGQQDAPEGTRWRIASGRMAAIPGFAAGILVRPLLLAKPGLGYGSVVQPGMGLRGRHATSYTGATATLGPCSDRFAYRRFRRGRRVRTQAPRAALTSRRNPQRKPSRRSLPIDV
jgi:hypothetical protein